MKILLMILGVLFLIGGIGVIGLVANFKTSNVFVVDAQNRLAEATKKWESTKDPIDREKVEEIKKDLRQYQATFEAKESEKRNGFILGAILSVIGLWLCGFGFVLKKRNT